MEQQRTLRLTTSKKKISQSVGLKKERKVKNKKKSIRNEIKEIPYRARFNIKFRMYYYTMANGWLYWNTASGKFVTRNPSLLNILHWFPVYLAPHLHIHILSVRRCHPQIHFTETLPFSQTNITRFVENRVCVCECCLCRQWVASVVPSHTILHLSISK